MKSTKFLVPGIVAILLATSISSCIQKETATPLEPIVQSETPEYFNLRPEL